MKFKSITYKWVINFIGIITIILAITNIIIFITVHQYFNNYAKESIKLNSTDLNNAINSVIKENSDTGAKKIKSLIENFTNYENIMVIGLDLKGDVIATSQKLSINNQNMCKELLKNALEEKQFEKMNLEDKNEELLTYAIKMPIVNNKIAAIAYISSLKNIKIIIRNIMIISLILTLVILFLIAISGVFFIKYFVDPVREINLAIKEIADGNLKYRIKKDYHYEIEELSNSINFMANEISTSEYLKNEFISSVSHELRTPLTAIQGWSETILSTKDNNEEIFSKGMVVISKEVVRLAGMVEELLDFSKMQNGHFILKKDKMDLFAELEEAVLMYSDVALKEGKTLKYNEQKAVPIIFGDKNRIRQIFINIIDNAIKYSEPGDKITIDATATEKKATVVVKDTGCGISEKDLSHITEKFFKSNLTKKGSGIGLSIVKEIVEQHDGTIKFESAKGKGTTVTIEFNLCG